MTTGHPAVTVTRPDSVDAGAAVTIPRPAAAVAAMAAVLGVFVARPLLPGGAGALLGLFALLLLVGAGWPLPGAAPPSVRAVFPLVAGIGAFGLVRLVGRGHPVAPVGVGYVAAIIFAAVAEEIFFRRFVYAVLRPRGAAVAVAGSAVLFAATHVTVYGWWVLPLDLAAGLVLGWQRWATGSWAVPAVTHLAANLLVVL